VLDSWKVNVLSAERLPAGSAYTQTQAGTEHVEIAGEALDWQIDVVNPIIGDALTIYFGHNLKAGTTVSVRIWYST
jgi:hypothetical protein